MIEDVGAMTVPAYPPQFRVLNTADAAMVWLLNWAGDKDHVIAAKLGTMPTRVKDVLTEQTHVGSRDKAVRLIGARPPL